MPYFYDANLPENHEDQTQSGMSGGGSHLSGSSSTTPSGSGVNPNSGAAQNSNPYSALNSYISNNNAQAFGNQFLDQFQGNIDQAKNSQSQAAQGFQNQVNSSNQVPTQSDISGAISNAEKATPDQQSQFQNWENQTYQGPMSLSDNTALYNQYYGPTQNAVTQAQLLGNESGRQTLLNQYFGNSGQPYSAGERAQDEVLLNQGVNAPRTQQLVSQAYGLQSQAQNQLPALQQAAANRALQVQASGLAARNAVGINPDGTVNMTTPGALGNLQQTVGKEVTAANTLQNTDYNQLINDIKSGSITPQEEQLFEQVSGGNLVGQGLWGNFDPTQYITQATPLTQSQVMTQPEISQYQALANLAGVPDTFTVPRSGDTGPRSSYNVNLTGLLSGEAQQSKNAVSDLTQAINTIKSQAPLSGAALSNLSASDPAGALNALQAEEASWIEQKLQGNPYADQRLGVLSNSINSLLSVFNKYGINPQTGIDQTIQLKSPGRAVMI